MSALPPSALSIIPSASIKSMSTACRPATSLAKTEVFRPHAMPYKAQKTQKAGWQAGKLRGRPMNNRIMAVLVFSALLWGLLPRMPEGAISASPSVVLQSSAENAQHDPPTAETLDPDELFRNIENYIGGVYYFVGEISHVEFMSDGYADSLIVKMLGDSLEPSQQYLHVDIEHTLNERVLERDIVRFTGRVMGLQEYESRPIPAVLLLEYLGRLQCEGDPPTCSEIDALPPAPAVAFTLKYAAPVRSGPGYGNRIVDRMEQGSTIRPIGRTADGRWLQLAEGQWILAILADVRDESFPTATVSPTPTATVPPTPTATVPPTPTATVPPTPTLRTAVTPTPTPQPEAGEEVADANAKAVQAYIEQGVAKAELGQYEEAIADYDAALRLDPDHAVALANRSLAWSALGRFEEAIADLDAVLRLDSDNIAAWTHRALAQIRLGRFEEAIADYDAALHLDPDNTWALNYRGWAKVQLGHYAEAIADYDAALRLDPDNIWALNQRGRAKAQLGRYAEAIADHDAALRLDPDDVWTLNYRGQAKAQLGRYAEAIADYDAALRLDPDNAMAYNNREQARAQMAQAFGATANVNANLREGPGTIYAVVGHVIKGDRIHPVAQSSDGTWLQLDSGHWIYAPLVDNVPPGLAVSTRVPPTPVSTRPTSTPTPAPTPQRATPTPTPTPVLNPAQYCPDVEDIVAEYWSDRESLVQRRQDTVVCIVGLAWGTSEFENQFFINLLPSNALGSEPRGWWPETRLRNLTQETGSVGCHIDGNKMDADTTRILGEINIDPEAQDAAAKDLRRVDILLVSGRMNIEYLLSAFRLSLKECRIHEVLLEVPPN